MVPVAVSPTPLPVFVTNSPDLWSLRLSIAAIVAAVAAAAVNVYQALLARDELTILKRQIAKLSE